ncbi:MAG: hypothetical protein LUE24_04830 [Lachnospiraceae bacterium]|nr:hypothetical protein [Lachnospiraceae bacterium]
MGEDSAPAKCYDINDDGSTTEIDIHEDTFLSCSESDCQEPTSHLRPANSVLEIKIQRPKVMRCTNRKRFIKLAMGRYGIQRNTANAMTELESWGKKSYQEQFDWLMFESIFAPFAKSV